jgi:pimeloyl-ACP methyl ester carboxylesterase
VKDALRDPANLGAAIGYYRAMLGGSDAPATAGNPTQPVLYLHGRNDGCLGVELTTSAAMFLSADSRVEVLDDCGHFLQVEQPDLVNKLVLDWITA